MELTERSKGLIIILIAVISFVPDSLFIKIIQTSTLNLTFWRSLLAGTCIILALTMIRRGNPIKEITKAGWAGYAYIFLLAIASLLFVYAIRTTSVANTLFIISTSPMFAAIASRILLKEPLNTRLIWAIALSMVGIGLITSGSLTIRTDAIKGDLAALLVAVMIAIKHTVARKAKAFSMVPAAGIAHLLLALTLFIFADVSFMTTRDMIYVIILGSLFIPVATSLMALGPRYLPAPEVALIILLEAILAPLLVWAVLGEEPTKLAIAGGSLVIVVLAVYNYYQLKYFSM